MGACILEGTLKFCLKYGNYSVQGTYIRSIFVVNTIELTIICIMSFVAQINSTELYII